MHTKPDTPPPSLSHNTQGQTDTIHTHTEPDTPPPSLSHNTQGQTDTHAHTEPDRHLARHTHIYTPGQTHPITHPARPELQIHTNLPCVPDPPAVNYNLSLPATKAVQLPTSALGARGWRSSVGIGPCTKMWPLPAQALSIPMATAPSTKISPARPGAAESIPPPFCPPPKTST